MKLPEDSRVWIGGGIAATVLILAAGWFGLVNPELSTVSSEHADADSASAANDVLQAKVTTLQTESRQLDSLVHGLAVARTELPIQADLPTYIRQLGLEARNAKVGITSLSIGAVSVSTTAGTAAAGTTDTTGTTDSGTTDSGTSDSGTSAAATPSPAATDSTGASAATAVVAAGPAGELFQIQVSVTTSGDLERQKAFLTAVQQPGTRAALVTSAQLAPAAAATGAATATAATPSPGTDAAESATAAPASIDGVSDLTTIMTIFVAPQTPAAAAELSKQLASGTAR